MKHKFDIYCDDKEENFAVYGSDPEPVLYCGDEGVETPICCGKLTIDGSAETVSVGTLVVKMYEWYKSYKGIKV